MRGGHRAVRDRERGKEGSSAGASGHTEAPDLSASHDPQALPLPAP